jgi:hypothetical protein
MSLSPLGGLRQDGGRYLPVPGNNDPRVEVRDTMNRSLSGWSNYFSYGTRRSVSRGVEAWHPSVLL